MLLVPLVDESQSAAGPRVLPSGEAVELSEDVVAVQAPSGFRGASLFLRARVVLILIFMGYG